MAQQIAFIGNSKRNRSKIEQEEKEIEELEKKFLAEGEGPEEEVEDKEETEKPEQRATEKSEPEPESAEEQTWKKRHGDLRRHSAKVEKELKEKIEALEAKTDKEEFKLPASDEDIDVWKSKYPDVAAIVESMAIKIADKKFEEANLNISTLREDQEQIVREKKLAKIRNAHKDFDDIQDSDDFYDWVEEQPKWVKSAVDDDDADAVIRVLDLYKADKGMTKTSQRATAKSAASAVKTKGKVSLEEDAGKPTFSESQVRDMSLDDYAANEAAINEAQRTGKFVYDLSGGVR